MKISIIIPNYNGAKLLERNLPGVMSAVANYKNSEIIVVDDASTDHSIDLLKAKFPGVQIVARKKNEGFASSVNDGIRKSLGDLVVLLNSDVEPDKNFLLYLLPHFNDKNVFAAGCLQETQSGQMQGRGAGKFEKGFLIHGPGSLDKKDTLWVFGGAAIYRKDIWHKLGGLDTVYNPFYWEDIDLSYRALKAGFKLVFESRSVVVHKQHSGSIRSQFSPSRIKTIAYRNQTLFVWLNITDADLIVSHLLYLPLNLIKALLRLDFAFWTGFLLSLMKLPEVIFKRHQRKKFNSLSDREVLKSFMLQYAREN